jgi:benzoyl-CoA 2,3-dioxygenase component B
MFTMFTDRDGKYQLLSLAESAFDPLSRSCRFMLTEEAHHLFVGETGVDRIVRRSAELTKLDPNGDAAAHGGIPLPLIQKYINLWCSLCLDLFGGEVSSNAATYFATGLKGRAHERRYADHAASGVRTLTLVEDGKLVEREIAERLALNEDVRGDYLEDCQRAVDRWNKTLEKSGLDLRLRLPSRRFHRQIGAYADAAFTPDGELISRAEFERRQGEWLPSDADRGFVRSLQTRAVMAPGQMANWIAAPAKGIDGKPVDFEYVRLGA